MKGGQGEKKAQSWQCHAVTLSGPRLNYLASCIPARLHHTLAYATAQGSLTNHFLLRQGRIEVGHQLIAVLARILAYLL